MPTLTFSGTVYARCFTECGFKFQLTDRDLRSQNLIVSAFSSNLDGCQFTADRRNSSVRPANDAEVEDILGIFNVLDTASALDGADFFISALDRLSGLYGPEEINLYAVLDRQIRMDAVLLDITASVAAISPTADASIASVIGGVTAALDRLEARARYVTGDM